MTTFTIYEGTWSFRDRGRARNRVRWENMELLQICRDGVCTKRIAAPIELTNLPGGVAIFCSFLINT